MDRDNKNVRKDRGRGRGGRIPDGQQVASEGRRPGQETIKSGIGRSESIAATVPTKSAWGSTVSVPRHNAPAQLPSLGRATSISMSSREPIAPDVGTRDVGTRDVGARDVGARGGGDTGGNGNGGNGRGSMRGKRVINEMIRTRPLECVSKKGVTGKAVVLQTNYFRALKKPNWKLYQYRVDFAPDIEMLRVRKGIIYSNQAQLGINIFDGTVLYSAKLLDADPFEILTKNRNDEVIKVTIKMVGVIEMTDSTSIQIFNIILRKAMEGLHLELVGRNYFDAANKQSVPQYKLELWPGYTTSFRQHETDILLCAEIAHKVMRTETLYSILRRCIQDGRNYQEMFQKEVIGTTTLTDYNNKTYRIDDVNYKASPKELFSTKNGNISIMQYYKDRYNIVIKDANQPLLVSRSTDRKLRAGQPDFIYLVPELCRATGITDQMKNDFHCMKAMGEHTKLAPSARIERLKSFSRRLNSAKESVDVLNAWELKLDQNLVELPGRILTVEKIHFGNSRQVPAGSDGDWTKEFRSNSLYVSAILKRWYVIVPPRIERDALEFVKCIRDVANGMKMQIFEPRVNVIRDDRNNTYVNAIEECAQKDPQLLMIIVPNNNAERYSCIKKKTCVDRPIPTQVMVNKTIIPKRGPAGLKSIATKVAIQMNCKLMGAPWFIDLPAGLMTVGFDVCHSSRDATKSYGAMVATMFIKSKKTVQFFSTVSIHTKGNELSNEISINMNKALHQYRIESGTLPERILFYRDGVGDGQFHQVIEHEVKNLKKRLDDIYKSANIPGGCKLCFIIVSKRINTRFFCNKQNPPPGTVVDDIVTLPERYDFYLVSQYVREGTVSPTNYNVVYDNMGFPADILQTLTYKFCHLYYNYSGVTRVPAVCQYAHKLSFLVGQSLHQCPSNLLEKQLYFL